MQNIGIDCGDEKKKQLVWMLTRSRKFPRRALENLTIRSAEDIFAAN